MADSAKRPFSRAAEEAIADLRRIPSQEPARMRRRPTREIGSVLDELLTRYRIGRSSPEETIRARWEELVGPANAAYSHPAQIDQNGRRLLVLAGHSVVRQELFLHRLVILERVRQLPGCAGIQMLFIRAG